MSVSNRVLAIFAQHAEGWRRHLHHGYSAHDDDDPLAAALADYCRRNPRAESIDFPAE